MPARSTVILEFYFATPHLIEVRASGERDHAAWAVAVGPQTFARVNLILSGVTDVFTVTFEQTGLYALFGIPMPEFTNSGISAEYLFGSRAASELHERLAGAKDFSDRARIMDQTLLARLPERSIDLAAVAATRLRRSAGRVSMNALAAKAGVTERHLRRLFHERVGMAPKTYARIMRFEAAMKARAATPGASWTEIAHQGGWFDQAHLDKDFMALTGFTPTEFARTRF